MVSSALSVLLCWMVGNSVTRVQFVRETEGIERITTLLGVISEKVVAARFYEDNSKRYLVQIV